MPGWQRVYLCVCCAVIGFALAYVLCDYSAWPRLTYFPYERRWDWTAGYPGDIPMAYVGTLLWGLGGAVVGAGVCGAVCALMRGPVSDRWLRLHGAWALASFAYGGMYFTWNLWPF